MSLEFIAQLEAAGATVTHETLDEAALVRGPKSEGQ